MCLENIGCDERIEFGDIQCRYPFVLWMLASENDHLSKNNGWESAASWSFLHVLWIMPHLGHFQEELMHDKNIYLEKWSFGWH